MIAAMRAAECGAAVTLLEKNERLGTKILISGGGKCNVTHAGPMEKVRAAFRANEALFLKPSFYRYSNQDFVQLLQTVGLQTAAREDGRIFPREPGNAKDVVAALERIVRRSGVEICTEAAVVSLAADDSGFCATIAGGDELRAARVVVAVGGSSYPATGTTGDGWRWAQAFGHSVVPPRAALAPIYLADAQPDWSGVALRDVEIRARASQSSKIFTRWRGDLLFTHKGISGPCALGVSREIAEEMGGATDRLGGIVDVDARPAVAFEACVAELKEEARQSPRKEVGSYVAEFLPNRLIDPVMERVGVRADSKLGQLSHKAITSVTRQIKELDLGAVRTVPLERGEVVAGGISLAEVDSKTMESRIVSGLFLCGEVLDLAGPVGGYNLQAAWSTGYVAGESAAG